MFELSPSQKIRLGPIEVVPRGARIEGAPQWASEDANILRVVPDADGLSATVFAVASGATRIRVTGDADLGAGTVLIEGFADGSVVSPTATGFRIPEGTPEEQ